MTYASEDGLYDVDDPWGEVLGVTKEGMVIARGKTVEVAAANNAEIQVRVPDLKEIVAVLHIQFGSDPATYVTGIYGTKKITGNVVGFTIQGPQAGTTLTSEVVAIGPGS